MVCLQVKILCCRCPFRTGTSVGSSIRTRLAGASSSRSTCSRRTRATSGLWEPAGRTGTSTGRRRTGRRLWGQCPVKKTWQTCGRATWRFANKWDWQYTYPVCTWLVVQKLAHTGLQSIVCFQVTSESWPTQYIHRWHQQRSRHPCCPGQHAKRDDRYVRCLARAGVSPERFAHRKHIPARTGFSAPGHWGFSGHLLHRIVQVETWSYFCRLLYIHVMFVNMRAALPARRVSALLSAECSCLKENKAVFPFWNDRHFTIVLSLELSSGSALLFWSDTSTFRSVWEANEQHVDSTS